MSAYRENAERALARVADFFEDESPDWPAVNAAVAQAEATLALVEAVNRLADQQKVLGAVFVASQEARMSNAERAAFHRAVNS